MVTRRSELGVDMSEARWRVKGMSRIGVAVHEEALISVLLADLSRSITPVAVAPGRPRLLRGPVDGRSRASVRSRTRVKRISDRTEDLAELTCLAWSAV